MPRAIQHICLADDDPDDYFIFEAALNEVNESVKLTYFNNCDALLEYLRTSDQLPDLVVLDMNMPGNDGNKCLAEIKRETRLLHIPVIIYSTSGIPSIIKSAQDCGAYNYLIKPPSIGQTKDLIKELLAIPVNV